VTAGVDESEDERADEVHRRRWATLVVLCLAMLLIIVNSSSLNVALPTLARELDASSAQLQWIVAAYSLVFAGLLFSCGTLGDRYGRKGTFQLGLVLFALAAGVASLSSEAWHVIACRGAMGLAAALIMPSTLSILVGVFPTHERPKAIAAWAGVTGVAGTIGPLGSGFLLEDHSFPAVFLMNLPIGALALLGSVWLVPRSRDPHGTALDPVGAGLSIVALTGFVYGLVIGPDAGWTAPTTLAIFAAALTAGVLFVRWELRHPAPMLDVRLFRNPAFSTGTAGMTTAFLALFGSTFLLAQHFQLVAGYSPLSTALRFLPSGATLVVVSAFTPRLVRRWGAHRTAGAGMGLVALAMALLLPLRSDSPFALLLASMVVLLTGLALVISPLTAAVMSTVPADRPGAASATNNSTRELGGAVGVALLGSWSSAYYGHAIQGAIAGLPPDQQATAASSLGNALDVAARLPAGAAHTLTLDAQQAFVESLRLAAALPLVLAVVVGVLVWRHLPR